MKLLIPKRVYQKRCDKVDRQGKVNTWSADRVMVRGRLTLSDLDEADRDDEGERQELRCSEKVLHSGGRLHAVAVHKRQQDCRDREQHYFIKLYAKQNRCKAPQTRRAESPLGQLGLPHKEPTTSQGLGQWLHILSLPCYAKTNSDEVFCL